MGDPFEGQKFPKGVLLGAGALLAASLSLAVLSRTTGYGRVEVQHVHAVQVRELRFEDVTDGSVQVVDVTRGGVVAELPAGGEGFVRGVLRGMVRSRRQEGIGRDTPLRLVRWSDGHLSLHDPATGRVVELDAFGETNARAFARLLDDEGGNG
ncbi:MAG: hypothetical protein KC933_14370 [Myxococcales bacterium]|nr:hypothetical protein [Myxococcales bacterium]